MSDPAPLGSGRAAPVPPVAHPGGGPLAALDRLARRASDWLLSGRAFALAIVGYCLFHALARSLLLGGGSNDDSEQLYHSQWLALGYDANNPPLYTWLVIGAQALVGVSLAGVLLTKFALLALFFLLLYGAAREATTDTRYAVAAALSPLAIYLLGWDALRHYSHSILLIAACAGLLLVVLRLARSRALAWYALLGLAVGIGLQAKYSFALYALALLLAALSDPVLRARLLAPRAAIAVAVALACVAPNAAWLLSHPDAVTTEVGSRLAAEAASWWQARAAAVWGVAEGLVLFLLPLAGLLAVLFPRALFRNPPALVEGPPAERARRAERLLGRCTAILFGLFVLLVALVGLERLENHVFFVFVTAPLWAFARASLVERGPAGLHRFVTLVLALCLVATGVSLARVFLDPLEPGRRASFDIPYGRFAEGLREAGFTGGTVYVHDASVTLAGNLRAALPDSRVLSSRHDLYRPPARALPGQCLTVWLAEPDASDPAPPSEAHVAGLGFGAEPAYTQGLVEAPLAWGWGRRAALGYRLYAPPVRCR